MVSQEVRNTLGACELKLRECLANAASSGDYEAVKEITSIATVVAKLRDGKQQQETPKSVTGRQVPRKQNAKYPIFSRRGDNLVKTGWSKKENSTYDHKANKSVLTLLANQILAAVDETGAFTTENLFPLVDAGEEIPAYQGYLCLAWFKDIGIVAADGRSGYRLGQHFHAPEQIWEHWSNLENYTNIKRE